MSKRDYPRNMPPQWRAGQPAKTCNDCKQPIPKNERHCVIEVQVNWMRGDDEVEFLCESCANKRGIQSPPTKEERRRAQLLVEVPALRKKIRRLRSELADAEKILAEREDMLREVQGEKTCV